MQINDKLMKNYVKKSESAIQDSGTYGTGVGNAYYIKFVDGTLLQYGSFGEIQLNPSSNQQITVILHEPFIDTNYSVLTTQGASSAFNTNLVANIENQQTNQMVIQYWNTNTTNTAGCKGTFWLAIGKWK